MLLQTASKNTVHSVNLKENLKIRSDAYGECELYGSHLVQVHLQMLWKPFITFYFNFKLFFILKQIDGLAENFCLLKYAHAEVGSQLN